MSFTVPKELESRTGTKLLDAITRKSAALRSCTCTPSRSVSVMRDRRRRWSGRPSRLGLEPINIYELVTFYPMFRQDAGRAGTRSRSAGR
jgi:hypothetical protein